MDRLEYERTASFVEALQEDEEGLVEAAVADGWPEAMVRAGLKRHWQTWQVDVLADSLRAELDVVSQRRHHVIRWPDRVHHIWPALPGAGLTPVLVGMLLGLPQAVRASRRGKSLAARICACAPWSLLEDREPWKDSDLVVISGSDETLEAIRRKVGNACRVVGYGHRVSFAVVVDDDEAADLHRAAVDVAADVVMWHQKGCFSVRAVLFSGDEHRRREFCRHLASAISKWEKRWEASNPDDSELAQRAQAIGVAQMTGAVFEEGIGYVREHPGRFDGSREAIHSVTVHSVAGPVGLEQVVDIASRHLQGVGMAGTWKDSEEQWVDALGRLGVNRVAPAGTLQAPPPDWWHDGRPNALGWGQMISLL